MQKRIKKHAWIYLTVAVLASIVLASSYYQFGYLSQKQTGPSSQRTVVSAGDPSETSPQATSGSTGVPTIAAGGPNIFATLSFSNATGFSTIVHPTSGTIEFVLLPNSTGEFVVTYTGIEGNTSTGTEFNNITEFSFTNPNVYSVNLSQNGTLGTGSGLSVTESNATWLSYYQVVVSYTVTSGESDGLYIIGLPSTPLGNTIVNIGTQPYTGPLTWLNGTFY